MIAGAAFAILLTLQAQAATPPPRPISVDAGIEWRADRYSYRADNPSTIDTPDLVPHFFTQHYRADAAWFTAAAHYTVLNGDADTRIAIAPAHRTVGSDIDTFFDPSGDVVTSGTDGPIDLRAFELSQRLALASWRGWQLGVTIDYRRSRADFRPDDIVVTHTMPASVTRTFTTDRETTISRVIESGVAAVRTHEVGPWMIDVDAAVLPLSTAQLTIQLPDKYPGQDLIVGVHAISARGGVTVARRAGPIAIGVRASAAGSWSFGATPTYSDRGGGVMAFVRLARTGR